MTNRKKDIKKRTPFGLKRKWFLTMMSLLMVFQILRSSFFVLAADAPSEPMPTAMPQSTSGQEPLPTPEQIPTPAPESTYMPEASATPGATHEPESSATPGATLAPVFAPILAPILTQSDDMLSPAALPLWKPEEIKYKLTLNDNEVSEGVEISSKDTLSLSIDFVMKLDINNPAHEQVITAKGPYSIIELPDEICLPTALASLEVTAYENGTSITLGTLNSSGKEIIFTFADDLLTKLKDVGGEGIGNGKAGFEVSLDMTEIGDKQDIKIVFGTESDAKTYSIKVEDNIPKDAEIEKTGKLNSADNTIEWTVTATMGGKEYLDDSGNQLPFVFKDNLGTKQSYVDGSFKAADSNGTSIDVSMLEVSRNTTTKEQTLTHTYTPDPAAITKGKTIRYTYKTKINPSAYVNASGEMVNGTTPTNAKIENMAQLWAGDASITKPAKGAVDFNMAKEWMEKTGNPMSGSPTGKVEWKIIIDTNGYGFESITLHDKLGYPEHNGTVYPLEVEKILYQYDTGLSSEMEGKFQEGDKFSLLKGEEGYTFTNLDGVNKIVVTYTSSFESEQAFTEYKRTNGSDPENEAWIDWEWKDYYGEGTEGHGAKTPSVSKPAGIVSGVIAKSGTYDSAAQEITWEITVNSNAITIDNLKVIDRIPKDQEYVDGSLVTAGWKANKQDDGSVEFIYETSPVTTKQTFQFKTKIIDKSFYADNVSSRTFTNTAELYEDTTRMAEVTAGVACKSQVIEKKAGAYHYGTQQLSWSIVVNQNKEEMKKIQVVDTLPTGLTLVEGSVKYKMEGGSSTVPEKILPKVAGIADAPGYSYTNGIFTIYLSDMDAGGGTATITYDTQVDVNKLSEFNTGNKDVAINNKAVLKNDYGYRDVESSATKKLPSNSLSKMGTIPNDNKSCIEYTVKINGSKVTLPKGSYIEDTLPAGLQLDLASIKLFEANVDAGGNFSQGTQVNGSNYRITSTGTPDGKLKFKLEFPADCGNKAYILVYRATIIDKDKAPFRNMVAMNNQKFSPEASHELSKEYINKNYSTGSLFRGTRLEINLTDSADEAQTLEGAVFELLYEGNVIQVSQTNGAGKITFYGLTNGTTYTLRQISAPAGYDNLSPIEIKIEKTGLTELPLKNSQKKPDSGNNNSGNAGGGEGGSEGSHNDSGSSEKAALTSVPIVKAGQAGEGDNALTQDNVSAYGEKQLPKTGGVWGTGIIYLAGAAGMLSGIAAAALGKSRKGKYKKAAIVFISLGAALILITLFSNLLSIYKKQQDIADFENKDLIVKAVSIEDIRAGEEVSGEKNYDAQADALLDENGVMAVLSIPSISCKEVIREGSSKGTLAKALGHMEGTAFPGQIGNCAIAGHRNYNFGMYFNRLDEVELDDEITISTQTNTFTYKVTEIKVVEPEDLSVLEQGDDTRVTLITCTPLYIATHRLIVIGELI